MIHKSAIALALLTGLVFFSQPSGAQNFGVHEAARIMPIHAKRLNSGGQVIGTFDVSTSSRQLSSAPLEQTTVSNAWDQTVIYDNTTTSNTWHEPGRNIEIIDFGASSGGEVVTFEFGYMTRKQKPGDITIRFYAGTNGSICPGTFLTGWTFSFLPGSTGGVQAFVTTFDIPVGETFNLPSGDFGYSYEFIDNTSTGVFLASGGAGNQDWFWKNCISTPHSGWAGFYMRVYTGIGVNPVLRTDPNSLTFDCLNPIAANSSPISTTTTTLNASLDKFIEREIIQLRFNQGQRKVHVIVNLADPEVLRKTTDWRSHKSCDILGYEVFSRQQRVLNQLPLSDFKLRHCYKYISAFSGEISEKALNKLIKNPLVISVQPVRTLYPHLNQGLALMNALSARSVYSGQGIAIAVCDTGTDYNHPQLGGGGFPNSKVIGGFDFGDNDSDPIPNNQGHGTSVSGLACGDLATFGDYVGGVAHSAKLYALKISSGSTGSATDAAIINAWDWCVSHQYDDPNHPIMVINTSFGGGQFFSACDGSFPALSTAASNAVAAGITLLCSAGNDGYCDSMAFPACLSDTISVGAVYDSSFGRNPPSGFVGCIDNASCVGFSVSCACPEKCFIDDPTAPDQVTTYSNSASFLDVFGPAENAYTTDIVGNGDDPTGNFTIGFGGTSAASPYVAGIVAALQSAALDLTGSFLTPVEVRNLLVNTGDLVTDPKASVTRPRVNLGNAVDSFFTCTGQSLTLFNDGNATLDITSITTPNWLTLSETPPFSLPANSSLELCVTADCNSCMGFDLNELIQIFSNDPNASPSYDVSVFLNCSNITLTLTGAVRTVAGFGIAGVELVADNGGGSDITDPNGMYTITVPLGWNNGTVTPSKARWSFDPNVVASAGPLLSDPNTLDYVGKISADFNLTATVDYGDYSVLNSYWMNSGCGDPNDPNGCGMADMDLNGTVNVNDLILFNEQWLGTIN